MGVFRVFTEIRQASQQLSEYDENPILYFRIFVRITAMIYKATTVKRFWLNSDDYLKVVNYIESEKKLPLSNSVVHSKYNIHDFV